MINTNLLLYKDTLPGKNDGITFVRVCGSTSSGCCTLRNQIRVKNCNNFYVFELLRPPRCDAKYCFSKYINLFIYLFIHFSLVNYMYT